MYRTIIFVLLAHYFSDVQELCFDRLNNFSGLYNWIPCWKM